MLNNVIINLTASDNFWKQLHNIKNCVIEPDPYITTTEPSKKDADI